MHRPGAPLRPSPTLARLVGALAWCVCLPAAAAGAEFEIAFSEKLDAATFLNAISDEPRFHGPWRELRENWRRKIAADPVAAPAFDRWLGRGIQLAYLLSTLPEESLQTTLSRFDDPTELLGIVESGLDEPAYAPVFQDFRAGLADVRTVLAFLEANGFREMRVREFGAELETARRRLSDRLATLDADAFLRLLESFTGRSAPAGKLRLRVLVFSRPLSFQLSGFAVGWSGDRDDFASLLAHEFLHKFNPSPANLERQRTLAESDPFYRDAWDRIHGEFREGKEEEFVEAAARWMVEQLGLVARTRSLRQLKFLYYSEGTGRGGAPLAGILFAELLRAPPPPDAFDYDAWIARAFASGRVRAGEVESRWRETIAPVSGMAGMVLAADPAGARVERVFPGLPATAAGLQPGDVLVATGGTPLAGRSREDVLDLLAGPSGREVQLVRRRGDDSRSVNLVLK